ncbi:hypothetical protein IEN85_22325 [Pelagicoccus sp. NFK12]|uniref:Uncharacterized protein n=1 Tax=Pelagicoccus enzymogenes TaxID=2773457 RepID=A0A927FBV4_9BACT|nr:hypothetical protein [Pelagicoccus enzymogenes]MBD5782252.1 hypothetical protein [Pelagicoccus enzymogenes]
MKSEKSKKIQAASLGACFGVAFGAAANTVFGDSILGVPALSIGLLAGMCLGYVLGDKLTKGFDN